jgi:hypothetical protein
MHPPCLHGCDRGGGGSSSGCCSCCGCECCRGGRRLHADEAPLGAWVSAELHAPHNERVDGVVAALHTIEAGKEDKQGAPLW